MSKETIDTVVYFVIAVLFYYCLIRNMKMRVS